MSESAASESVDLNTDTTYSAVVNSVKPYGIFVDLKDDTDVGGLAHETMLPGNRESEDYEPGDTVRVKFEEEKDDGDLSFKVVSDSFSGYDAVLARVLSSEQSIHTQQESVTWNRNDKTPSPLEVTNPALDALKTIRQGMENNGSIENYNKKTDDDSITLEIEISLGASKYRAE